MLNMTHNETMRYLDLAAEILTELLADLKAMNRELEDGLTIMQVEEIVNEN